MIADIREVHIAVDGVLHADLVFPVLAGCAGEAVLAEGVLEPREVVDHARGDGVVVRDAEGFGIPGLDLSVPQRNRQSGRSGRTWLVAERRRVPEEADALLVPIIWSPLALHLSVGVTSVPPVTM